MKLLFYTFLFIILCATPRFLMAADLSAGNVVVLDGINDYVNVPHTTVLEPADEVSYEIWVYQSDWANADTGGILDNSNYDTGGYYLWLGRAGANILSASVRGEPACGDGAQATYNVSGLSTGWHHFAVTYDNQTLRMYIDGAEVTSNDGGQPCDIRYIYDSGVWFGQNQENSAFFAGRLDEARIYDRALDAGEIDGHYNVGLGESGTAELNLIGAWHFDEGTGVTAADYSGNSLTASLNSGTTWGPRTVLPNSISSVVVASFGTTTATISWNSSEVADAIVQYGTTLSYGSAVMSSTTGTTHSLTITGLTATTTYYYKVFSYDGSQLASSGGHSFKTLDFDPTDNIFYVSPTGSDLANGAIGSPWNITKAFSHPAAVLPGATIYLRGGTYYFATTSSQRAFTSVLTGTASEPIVMKSYPGEWAVVDGNLNGVSVKNGTIINITGSYTWYQNFEVTNTSIVGRKLDTGYNVAPNDERGGAFDDRGSGNKLINLLIHDAGAGVGAWANGSNGEYYGNVVYNNGWDSPTGGTGHNVYSQNTNGYKLWTNNVMFNAFNMLSKLGGENESQINNTKFEGNTFFNGSNFWSGPVFRNLDTFKNYTYAYGWKFGNEESATYYDIDIRDNYLVASSSSNQIFPFVNGANFKYNTLISTSHTPQDVLLQLHVFNPNDYLTLFSIDYNTYYNSYLSFPFNALIYDTEGYAFNATQGNQATNYGYTGNSWQGDLGFDLNSTFYEETPTPAADQVFYRKNKYDANKETVTVYNWDGNTTVTIDPSLVLDSGDTYALHNVQDYFGDVITGTYSGSPISITMTGRTRQKPVGYDEVGGTWYIDPLEPVTFPVFGVFVLENTSGTSDVAGPVISRVASTTTSTSATVTWDTNEDARTVLQYGLTTSYGNASTTSDGSIYGTFYVTTHGISLTSLTSGTVYHYRLVNTDYAGNVTTSPDYTFTTSGSAPGDTTDPVISSVASSTTSTTATITWDTDESATSTVSYGLTTSYGSVTSTGTSLTSHSHTLTGLTANTVYHFQISVGDTAYNFATSSDYTFTTATESAPAPATPSGGGGSRSGGGGGGGGTTAPVATTTATTTCTTIVYPTLLTNLALNSQGTEVITLKKILTAERLLATSTTAIYDLATVRAVEQFQVKYTIATPTTPGYGKVGPKTRTFINLRIQQRLYPSLGVCLTQIIPRTATTTTYTFTRTLTLGSTGPDVKALQIYLNTNGFKIATTGIGSPGRESTYFGPATKAALVRFQISKGITPASGIFGPLTRGVVNGAVMQ